MNRYVAAYAGTATVMVALDLLWLGVIAKPLYQQGIGHLMAEQPVVPVPGHAEGLATGAVADRHGLGHGGQHGLGGRRQGGAGLGDAGLIRAAAGVWRVQAMIVQEDSGWSSHRLC